MKSKILLSIIALACIAATAWAQDKSEYKKEQYQASNGQLLNYRILYPQNFDRTKSYPVIVFLHGMGQRGDNNESQLDCCAETMIRHVRAQTVQPIVIFPQCPEENTWVSDPSQPPVFNTPPSKLEEAIMELLDNMIEKSIADPRQLHIAGLSMGGMGTFDMLFQYPNTFATATPICGRVNADRAAAYKGKTAIRIYHGDMDNIVSVEFSRNAYPALKKANANVTYTEYVGVKHNSWEYAVAEPDFVSWMLEHKK